MQTNDFMKFFDADFAKNMTGFGFPFDMKGFMDSQSKNMQAITEAQQLAMEGMQAVIQRQNDMISQMVQDNSTLAQEIMTESSPEQKIARQAEIMKTVYERSIRDMKEIGELISKSNQDASEVLNKRITASLNEIKAAASKTKKAA
ncbi:MAG: phasin family protein [Rhodospirillales bacterium]|nr:phasin family protein [Rhodospirillales bacterium]MCB9995452.1 phasin family protein [Rhodospirillales bacterium]